ncbi:MAG: cation diffusion facilitator family transporter [Myxococcales bacterium]|nr:cation diffusion facilitator family transporter [Myxococcota bacterium]MDW8283717.1 cation diffusion facilitator family transporter [Myxococcales bacterium]
MSGPGHHAPCGHQDHEDFRRGDRQRLSAALVVTLSICIAEFVGGILSGSLALTSDAGHMFSDLLGEVLALLALVVADRPADERRTFGYHRIEILMALLQGAMLFALAGMVIWHGILRLRAPPAVQTGLMLAVAAVGLLANLVCALLLRGGHSLNVRGAYLHVLLDGLSSVAVLVGGLVMWVVPGMFVLDPLLSIAIGLFVCYSAYRLASDAVEVLLEAVPRHLDLADIERGLLSVGGIRHVHALHVWSIASGVYALSAHLVVECEEVKRVDALLAAVRRMLTDRYRITHSTLQIEADACTETWQRVRAKVKRPDRMA